jgi:hypothetical protein
MLARTGLSLKYFATNVHEGVPDSRLYRYLRFVILPGICAWFCQHQPKKYRSSYLHCHCKCKEWSWWALMLRMIGEL